MELTTVEALCYALWDAFVVLIQTVYNMTTAEALCNECIFLAQLLMLVYLAFRVVCLLHDYVRRRQPNTPTPGWMQSAINAPFVRLRVLDMEETCRVLEELAGWLWAVVERSLKTLARGIWQAYLYYEDMNLAGSGEHREHRELSGSLADHNTIVQREDRNYSLAQVMDGGFVEQSSPAN